MNNLKRLISKPIGLGTANIQPYLDQARSKRIIYAALDAGISLFDTSPRYGLSEKFLGDHLPKNESVIISTKVGLDPITSSKMQVIGNQIKTRAKNLLGFNRYKLINGQAQPITPSIVYDFESFQNSIERSLRLLQRERLDVLRVHEPENIINLAELLNWIDEKRQQGLVRFRGLAIHRLGINMLDSRFDDDLIWQYPQAYRAVYQSKCPRPIIFGARKYLFDGRNPADNLKRFIEAEPQATLLTQTSNHRHLDWIKNI